MSEFSSLLSLLATSKSDYVITGDFNIHVDQPLDTLSQQFNSLLSSCNAVQHVSTPTHSDNHTLDLVITLALSALDASSVTILPYSPSDHFPVICLLNHCNIESVPKSCSKSYRRINSIDIDQFCCNLDNSSLIQAPPGDLNDLVQLYNATLSGLLDKHAPLKTKTVRESNPWFTPELKRLKAACRKAERKWPTNWHI
jgi:hypothetical protein